MGLRRSVGTVAVGLLSMLAGVLMTEGGVMEAIVYWPRGDWISVGIGMLGGTASLLLLAGGVAFLTRRSFARPLSAIGAVGMIPVHLLGFWAGNVGWPGLILGSAYPLVLLVFLRLRPSFGAGADAKSASITDTGGRAGHHPRTAAVVA